MERSTYTENFKLLGRAISELQLTSDENGKGITYRINGFKYDDFNRAGLLSFTKLCKHIEFARVISLTGGNFSLYSGDKSIVLVVGEVHVEVSKALYEKAGLTSQLKCVYNLVHIGNSTALFRVLVIDQQSSSVVASFWRHMIQMNLRTRKATPFTSSVKAAALDVVDSSGVQKPPRLLLPPVDRSNCFCCKITVKNTEMDMYKHTTQIVYMEYVMEAAAQATAAGYLKALKGDICRYCVKMASCLHKGESFAGDELSVLTWEDDSNPLLLYFIISKNDRDIFLAKMEFYNSHISSHL